LDLIRINDVVENFGISSRTLRYYEQVGILRLICSGRKWLRKFYRGILWRS